MDIGKVYNEDLHLETKACLDEGTTGEVAVKLGFRARFERALLAVP
jgi:hypothetical protein